MVNGKWRRRTTASALPTACCLLPAVATGAVLSILYAAHLQTVLCGVAGLRVHVTDRIEIHFTGCLPEITIVIFILHAVERKMQLHFSFYTLLSGKCNCIFHFTRC
jgi:hypothetical protein